MVNDEKPDLPKPWQWPGLWTLNLPVLAVLWQLLFARSFHVWLDGYHLFTAAALVWTFAVIERWIFFFRLRPDSTGELLSGDAAEQKTSVTRLCLLIVAGLILIAILRANTRETAGLLIWTSIGGAYLAALRLFPAGTGELLPREMALSAFLAGTAALFVWANGAFPPVRVLLPALLFLLLFFYYFCLVTAWSKPLLPALSTGPLLESTLGAAYRGVPLFLILSVAVLTLMSRDIGAGLLLLTIGVSGLILLLLDLWRGSLSHTAARFLADIAMLTPAVPLLIGLLDK